MSTTEQSWAVTEVAHPALRDVREKVCADCLALAESAVTYAAVTGSRGGSYDSAGHSATVTRALAVIVR